MSAQPSDAPPLSRSVKVFYGLGAMANAIKQRGLSTFLMIFYNQVVGLPPDKVAAVLMIALIFDALVDPLIGQISDNFRSPWGRRHPFMIAAALPVSVAFFLLWNPPQGWSENALFIYMIACVLTIRLFDTFFELPHQALAPELAQDYHQRTSLISMRMLFAVVGGLGMTLMAYQVFLKENPDGTGGVLARDGYFSYSLAAGLLIFAVILISSFGTSSRIPYLREAPLRKITARAMAREVGQTLKNRGFIVTAVTGMLIAIATGSKNGLELYFGIYFWELTQGQLALLTTVSVVGSAIGVIIAPQVARMLGKKTGAILMFTAALAIGVAPITLRLMELLPPNGTQALLIILLAEQFLNTAMAAGMVVLLLSMVADVVEDAEVKTGRRSEGLLLSADNLFKKMVSGVGVFIAGAILKAVHFPTNAERGAVDPEILRNLALTYLPMAAILYGAAILTIFAFNIDRAKHEENLRILAARRAQDAASDGAQAPAAAPATGGLAPAGPSAI
ncbi:MAG: MFS transporter [Phenylobacterium sp.]|uniref:MFS transporter n=1 Tax=Phenylobacterium sp. TaxID=1871053 RepID=UPI00391A82E7